MVHTQLTWKAERILYYLYKNEKWYFAREIADAMGDMSPQRIANVAIIELKDYVDVVKKPDKQSSHPWLPINKYKYNGVKIPEKLVENMEWTRQRIDEGTYKTYDGGR